MGSNTVALQYYEPKQGEPRQAHLIGIGAHGKALFCGTTGPSETQLILFSVLSDQKTSAGRA